MHNEFWDSSGDVPHNPSLRQDFQEYYLKVFSNEFKKNESTFKEVLMCFIKSFANSKENDISKNIHNVIKWIKRIKGVIISTIQNSENENDAKKSLTLLISICPLFQAMYELNQKRKSFKVPEPTPNPTLEEIAKGCSIM